jgi:hypothetical protein
MQPKPAIFALSRACIARGTGSSNPSPSSEESANHQFLSGGAYRHAWWVAGRLKPVVGRSMTLFSFRCPSCPISRMTACEICSLPSGEMPKGSSKKLAISV